MVGQHYGTQEVIRACIRPGMLIRHEGITWTAGANRRGKLIISTLRGTKVLTDCFVDVLLNAKGEPMGEYSQEIQWTYQL